MYIIKNISVICLSVIEAQGQNNKYNKYRSIEINHPFKEWNETSTKHNFSQNSSYRSGTSTHAIHQIQLLHRPRPPLFSTPTYTHTPARAHKYMHTHLDIFLFPFFYTHYIIKHHQVYSFVPIQNPSFNTVICFLINSLIYCLFSQ